MGVFQLSNSSNFPFASLQEFLLSFQDMELLLLGDLQWELSAVTSLDYLDHALPRLGLQSPQVKNVAQTILAVAATEYAFSYARPSVLAAAAVVLAVRANDDDAEACREAQRRVKAMLHVADVS